MLSVPGGGGKSTQAPSDSGLDCYALGSQIQVESDSIVESSKIGRRAPSDPLQEALHGNGSDLLGLSLRVHCRPTTMLERDIPRSCCW